MRALPLILVVVLFLGAVARDGFDRWIDTASLPPLAIATSPEVLARDGSLLRAYQVADGRWRLAVQLGQTDPHYIAMLIAYEDQRFYRHNGVDLRALMRAAGQAAMNGRIMSGGSTLTMQVARLLEDGPTGAWRGKLRQMQLAWALERRLSKDEILALYLNRAPYGGNLEGVRSATRAWFGKEPTRLTTAEAALLVALPQSPTARRPDRHPEAARAARDHVLAQLVRRGAIDAGDADAARAATIPTRREFPALAPHLADHLRAARPDAPRITTTIDARLQHSIEVLAARVARTRASLSVAIVVADHTDGTVLAQVGSAAYGDAGQGYVDMTQALRSPGSTLKPLIYGMAFDQGLAHPETLIDDRATTFGTYAPQNFDGQFRGTVRVRDALIQSLNIPPVRLTEALGPARLVAQMRRAGMQVALPDAAAPGLA
ncbi:MAG: penicillin-binding protein 1C, partial [Paracoccaceae bacterium]